MEPSKDSPLRSKKGIKVDSNDRNDQYIAIEITSKWKDAAQTMIPFFDAQTFEPLPSAPLQKIGIHHRGTDDAGGFFGFHGETIDFGKFVLDTYKPFAKEIEEKIKSAKKIKNGNNPNENGEDDEEDDEVF